MWSIHSRKDFYSICAAKGSESSGNLIHFVESFNVHSNVFGFNAAQLNLDMKCMTASLDPDSFVE